MESLNEDLRFKIIAAAIYDVAVYEFEQVEAVLVSLCTALSTSALRPCLDTAHRLSYEINFGKGWTLDALGWRRHLTGCLMTSQIWDWSRWALESTSGDG